MEYDHDYKITRIHKINDFLIEIHYKCKACGETRSEIFDAVELLMNT